MNAFKFLSGSKDAMHTINADDLLIVIDDDTREKMQKLLLDIYLEIYEVCRKHNITPYLIGGSALGAVRHKGFIPWDDDLDIGMTRADYTRFKELFNEELSAKYSLNAPNYSTNAKERFPKILKKGTVLREVVDSPDPDLHRVFLDIFILENVPDSFLHFKMKGLYCNLLEFIAGKVFFYENRDDLSKKLFSRAGKVNYLLRVIIGGLFSWKSSSKWFDAVDKNVQYNKPSRRVTIATGRKHYFGEVFDRNLLFPATMAIFEGHELPIFHDYDTYLKNLYHDYMVLPPVEKRERHAFRELKF